MSAEIAADLSSAAQWALFHARRGMFVLPLYEAIDGACACGQACASPAKHPRVDGGYKAATTDEATIRAWWERWPNANVGIDADRSNMFVLDYDSRNDVQGHELREMIANVGETGLAGVKVTTGGGGWHLWFRPPSDGLPLPNKVGKGFDVIAKGKYVVAPPSRHASGHFYQFAEGDALKSPGEAAPVLLDYLRNCGAKKATDRSAAAIDAVRVPVGKRHTEMTAIAGMFRKRGFGVETIDKALHALYGAVFAQEPAMTEDEIRSIAADIGAKATKASDPAIALRAEFVPMSSIEEREVDWLWADRIPVGMLSLIVGDPGGGKSYLTMRLAADLTRGVALPGDAKPWRTPCDVLMVNYEDAATYTLKGRSRKCGADGDRLKLVRMTAAGKEIKFAPEHIDEIEAVLDKLPDLKVLILDPVASFVGKIDPNRDTEVRSVLDPLTAFAARRGIAVVGVMHLRKAEAERIIYKVGGSIGFVGAARSVLLAGVNEESGRRSIDAIKHNLSGPSAPIEYEIDVEGCRWLGEASDLGAESVVGNAPRKEVNAQTAAAMKFLDEVLPIGSEIAKSDLDKLAAQAGVTDKMLRKAKDELKAGHYRTSGFPAAVVWKRSCDIVERVERVGESGKE